MESLFAVGTIVLFIVALAVLGTALYAQGRRLEEAERCVAELRKEQNAPGIRTKSEIMVEADRRLTLSTKYISARLDPYFKLPPHQLEDRLMAVMEEVRMAPDQLVLAEIAEGMAILTRAVPQLAMHAANHVLLARMRGRLGSSYLYGCGQMAVKAAMPGGEALAEALRNDEFSWKLLLEELASLGLTETLAMAAARVESPPDEPPAGASSGTAPL
ncbi:MAG TPA: hypothetical protein VGM19_14415 [Armatimonadota bacterium]|jgi:hypothetical protein